jgi:CheY-like chemotaxis protein
MKKEVLIVFQHPSLQYILQTVMGKDYHVVVAPDGVSALYWISKKNIPDLVISDSLLPDMNEWELIEQLNSSGLYQSIPIVVISSSDQKTTMQQAERMDLAGAFIKPFDPMAVKERIDQLLQTGWMISA